jgi:hypothetical protein
VKLMTKAIEAKLPALYSQEGEEDPIVYMSLFSIRSPHRWLVTEGERTDEGDMLLFNFGGWPDPEWGYVTLSELASLTFATGVPVVERDLSWTPTPLSKARARVGI